MNMEDMCVIKIKRYNQVSWKDKLSFRNKIELERKDSTSVSSYIPASNDSLEILNLSWNNLRKSGIKALALGLAV